MISGRRSLERVPKGPCLPFWTMSPGSVTLGLPVALVAALVVALVVAPSRFTAGILTLTYRLVFAFFTEQKTVSATINVLIAGPATTSVAARSAPRTDIFVAHDTWVFILLKIF